MSHLKNPENCHTLLKKREFQQEEGAHRVDSREEKESTLMQVEFDHIQEQDQEADAENSRTESSEESNLGNPVKMEKVKCSDADGLEMWDSSSNTYTKVDDSV